jgi:hypothetical protein
MLLFYFLEQIDLDGPCRQVGVGFDGRGQIGLCHQMPTFTPEKPIGAGPRRFCTLKS